MCCGTFPFTTCRSVWPYLLSRHIRIGNVSAFSCVRKSSSKATIRVVFRQHVLNPHVLVSLCSILWMPSDSGNFCLQGFLFFFVSHFDICTKFTIWFECHHQLPSRPKKLQSLIRNKIENNRPASNYRHYRFIINRKQYGGRKIRDITDVTVVTVIKKWHWQDHGRTLEVHISKHSLFRLKITVGCLTSTYPSIHVETPSRSRSVDWRAHIQAFTFLLTKTLSRSRSVDW